MDRDESVHIILFSNKKRHFEKIKTEITKWDVGYTRLLKLEFVPVRYPPGRKWMRELYRPCDSFGIFLPDLLPYDSIIYTDTDILFLQNIHHLWSEFSKFNSSTLVRAALRILPSSGKFPAYHKLGINSGVMLMNLTKMREKHLMQKVVAISMPYLPELDFGLEVRKLAL